MNWSSSFSGRLALGTAQFGLHYGVNKQQERVSVSAAGAILQHAWAGGIGTLDTAVAYGDSEQRLGAIGVQDWKIVSKLPAVPPDCRNVAKWMSDTVNGSLERLRIGSLYGLLLHRPEQLLESGGDLIYEELLRLKDDGVVRRIGVSIYDPSELDPLFSRFPFDLIQAPFNIFDRRLVDSGWLVRLGAEGTELHIRSIFLQGLLLMKAADRPPKFNRWASLWSRYDAWLDAKGVTPVQACLGHVLSFPEVQRIVVGVDTVSQLEEIMAAAVFRTGAMPVDIRSHDVDLLNPSRWTML